MKGQAMHEKLLPICVLIILMASIVVGCGGGGGSPCSTLTTLSMAEGDVLVMKVGTNTWVQGQVGTSLNIGDTVKTGDNSGALVTFFDGSTIELEAGTQIESRSLARVCSTGVTTITLLQAIGTTISRVTALLDPASSYKVETLSGAAAVRGRVMIVTVGADGTTWITNVEGNIWAIAQGVELPVPPGQQCIIRPGQPPALIMMVAAGEFHTVGLESDGSAVAVGINDDGQCDVGNWTDITRVAAGAYHTVGLKSDGTVVAAGCAGESGHYGQCDVGNWTGIIQVAAGNYHTVGVKSDGTVLAVGMNDVGQCNVSGWTDIIQVAAGYYPTLGVKSDGTAVAAGPNLLGECNVSGWTGIIQAAAGEQHTVGLKGDGTLVTGGDHAYEQCEVGTWDLN